MRQHHAAGTDADTACCRRDGGNQHFRRGTREGRRIVVLCKPVARIAETFRSLRKLDRIGESFFRRAALADRRLIENAQADHRIRLL